MSSSSPWSACPHGCVTPQGPLEYHLSPPNSHCCTVAPTEHFLMHHPMVPYCFSGIYQHPNILIYRRQISIIINNCLPKVSEGLRRWQGLCIVLKQDTTCIKAALYGLALESPLLSLFSDLQHIVPGVHPPQWDLATSVPALGEGFELFF